MPIPPITEHGYLPPGVHECSLGEAQGYFGVGPARERLWQRFLSYLERIRQCGLFVRAIIDGRFVSADDEVRDIDVALVPRNLLAEDRDSFRMMTDPQVKRELYEDFSVKTYFATNPPVGQDFTEWFQNIKTKDASRFGSPSEARKGILVVDL